MDIGCGTGITAKWLMDHYHCEALGVEVDSASAEQASQCLTRCYCESASVDGQYITENQGSIDLLLALDVLEHIEDPWGRLSRFRQLLSTQGAVIASIPNVRNMKVILPLVFKGEWRYTNAGILDRSHLRFFTKSSIERMFLDAGYEIDEIVATGPTRWKQIKSVAGYLVYIANLALFGQLEQFIAHQYLIKAKIAGEND
jgi:2-polyprenyl-3-methyl-5-hydroxy-6-metoxy-1,4-benzoquinol methylase